MKLIQFPEQTVVIAEDQPQYLPLPAHRFHGDKTGRIAFCWQMTWRERFKCLFTGKLWHQVLTFNQPLQPQFMATDKPEMPTIKPTIADVGYQGAFEKCSGAIVAALCVLTLCSCEGPSEYLAIAGGANGNVVRERRLGQIGGTRSSSRSDGSSEVNNYENSLRDGINAVSSAYGLKQVRIGRESDNAKDTAAGAQAADVTKAGIEAKKAVDLGGQVPVHVPAGETVIFPPK